MLLLSHASQHTFQAFESMAKSVSYWAHFDQNSRPVQINTFIYYLHFVKNFWALIKPRLSLIKNISMFVRFVHMCNAMEVLLCFDETQNVNPSLSCFILNLKWYYSVLLGVWSMLICTYYNVHAFNKKPFMLFDDELFCWELWSFKLSFEKKTF